MNIKSKLLTLGVFEDNEFLDKYVNIIESNYCTEKEKGKTQRHHIIPRCYFKTNNLKVDNSTNNVVNLLYKDHILAHCYIVLSSKEGAFKYQNYCAINHLLGVKGYELDGGTVDNLDEIQLAYESSKSLIYANNPMFVEEHKNRHDRVVKSDEFRKKVSESMKKYREEHPFTEEHRKKISESMMGNHNIVNSDTRSVSVFCVDHNTGEEHHFHNYKIAGKWWYDMYNPFNTKYSECTMQRKIKMSIKLGYCTFGSHKNKIYVNDVTWYHDNSPCEETIESI